MKKAIFRGSLNNINAALKSLMMLSYKIFIGFIE